MTKKQLDKIKKENEDEYCIYISDVIWSDGTYNSLSCNRYYTNIEFENKCPNCGKPIMLLDYKSVLIEEHEQHQIVEKKKTNREMILKGVLFEIERLKQHFDDYSEEIRSNLITKGKELGMGKKVWDCFNEHFELPWLVAYNFQCFLDDVYERIEKRI